MTNATCFTKHAALQDPPLIQNGQLTFQAHHVGWVVSFFFTLVATITSFWLISKHLMWYTQKRQQRYIVRLLLMVPIYATVSLASYIFWNHAIPITLARDSYEAFVLYSFFYLLLQYLSPTQEGQKEVFRNVVIKKWMFPLGFVKYRPVDGLYFLQLMKWGVLQYCVVRPTTTLAAVILDVVGLYCEASWSPGWGHVYITVIVSISVSIGMYCLLQLYMPVAEQLAVHKPLLKLFAVKAVVFLTFWQATFLSILAMLGVVKDTKYMTAEDINTGFAAILETFEMMCFAFLHLRAFSYIPYRTGYEISDRTPRFRSFMHALDFRDLWREIRDGSVYMGRTVRGVDADEEFRKRIHFARVMGRERELNEAKWPKQGFEEMDPLEEDTLLHGHGSKTRQARGDMWLSDPGNRFGGPFKDEVERELRERDLYREHHHLGSEPDGLDSGHTRGQSSWWRRIYDRFSQGMPDDATEGRLSPIPQRTSHARRSRKHRRRGSQLPSLDSPPPPAAVIYEYASLGEGQSSVQLSQSHRRSSDVAWEDRDMRRYHRHRQKATISDPPLDAFNGMGNRAQPVTRTRAVVASQPVVAPRVNHVELLASRDEKPLPVVARPSIPDQSNHRLASHSNVKASCSSTPMAHGHVSYEGRINPALSHDQIPAEPISPLAVSSFSGVLISPTGGRSSEPFSWPIYPRPDDFRSNPTAPTHLSSSPPKSRPRGVNLHTSHRSNRGHTRPDIVLPTQLSPVRHTVQPLQAEVHSQSHVQPLSLNQINHDHMQPNTRRPDRHSHRYSSAQIERLPTGKHQPTAWNSVPEGDIDSLEVRSAMAPRVNETPDGALIDGDGRIPLNWTTAIDRSSDSPIGSESPTGAATLLNTPSSPPPRALRHVYGHVGRNGIPWS